MNFTQLFTLLLLLVNIEKSYSQSFGQTACQIFPCENNGVCVDVTGTTRNCNCVVGYGGTDCQYDTNACQPQPCQNDGTCSSSLIMKPYADFTIEIPSEYCWNRQIVPGWTMGGSKEQCYEAVKLNKDAGGGCFGRTFLYYATTGSCACGTDTCESRQDQASGWTTYMQESLEEESTCTCPQYFTGSNCETALPTPCTNNPCQNSGVCNLDGSVYSCDCPTGYDGVVCQFDTDACDPDLCENGATCTSVIPQGSNVATHTCDCPTGYTGTNCEEDINECDPDPCQNGATCRDSSTDNSVQLGNYLCDCLTGFVGTNCEIDIDACDPNLCENGGVCNSQIVVGGSEYTCDCPTGYTGTNCEQDINECDPDPCQNNATCTQGIGEYTCECLPGYTGTNCEEDINECDPDPCQNGATCTQGIGEYTCECPTGYNGTNCEEDINECDPDPCQNGATCTQGIGEYTCECPTGYNGTNCEEDVSENFCNPNPCLYNSVCTQVNGTHICECPPGHVGPHCELNVAMGCDSEPCENGGTCENLAGDGFVCNCSITGYNGTNCEIEVVDDLCDPNPCFGQANRCTQDEGTYICECQSGHKGINCDIHTELGCDAVPCQNNGTCENLAGDGFVCTCEPPFTGKRCESDANTENTATNIILICLLIILVIIISWSCGILCCSGASAAVVVKSVKKLEKEQLLNTIEIIF